MNLLPNGNRLADLENKLTASKGQRRRGKINWESEMDIHMLPYTHFKYTFLKTLFIM